jgi:uridine phosphorylase
MNNFESKLLERVFPILEYDPDSKPIIEAKNLYAKQGTNRSISRCLITYFQDVVEKYERDEKLNQAFRIKTEGVRPRVYEMQTGGETIYVIPVAGGAPQAARTLESLSAMGVHKFMVCGGAGTLDDAVTLAKVLVPIAAVRDEGTSYHYLPPAREVFINPAVLRKIEDVLTAAAEPYVKIKTWTTDANFRETVDKVAFRKSEGCSTVEMECSAYYAVAQHKKLLCGQLLYAGDIVKKEGWQYRNWHAATDIREKLFELAVKCLMNL